jgi:inhibitor of KinA
MLKATPMGERAVLFQLGEVADERTHAAICVLDEAIAAAQIKGVVEVVPALINLLVAFDPLQTDHGAVAATVQALEPGVAATRTPQVHLVPVCYDPELCPDLLEVAALTSQSVEAVIAAHLNSEMRVEMYGFSPGYAYLRGLPQSIHLPRKPAAVRDITKGSIIISGAQSLITTLTMPTGWWVIGRSGFDVIESEAPDPFVFKVGDRVVYERISRAELDA